MSTDTDRPVYPGVDPASMLTVRCPDCGYVEPFKPTVIRCSGCHQSTDLQLVHVHPRRPDADEDEPFGPVGEFQVIGPDGGGGWTIKFRQGAAVGKDHATRWTRCPKCGGPARIVTNVGEGVIIDRADDPNAKYIDCSTCYESFKVREGDRRRPTA
jgi:Zn finger protein HypA/HybF involved in hydrogenase expression